MIRKFLVLAMLASAMPALAATYLVSIDTSTVSGLAGSLFFSFGPGAPPFDPATAAVSGFTGGTLGPGILPGDLVLDNSAPAFYQQAFTFGSQITFLLTFAGPAISSPNPGATGGTDFALFLLDNSDSPLLTDDPNGSILDASIEAGTGNVSFTTFPNAGGGSVVSVAVAPEPGTAILFLLVLVGHALACRLQLYSRNQHQ